MIERLQFWGVLLWMLGMLALAVFAVRRVWRDATARHHTPKADTAPAPRAEGTNPRDP